MGLSKHQRAAISDVNRHIVHVDATKAQTRKRVNAAYQARKEAIEIGKAGGLTAETIAEVLKVSRATLYRML